MEMQPVWLDWPSLSLSLPLSLSGGQSWPDPHLEPGLSQVFEKLPSAGLAWGVYNIYNWQFYEVNF